MLSCCFYSCPGFCCYKMAVAIIVMIPVVIITAVIVTVVIDYCYICMYIYIYIYIYILFRLVFASIVMSLVRDEVDVEIVRLSLLLLMLPPLFLISQIVTYSCFITTTTTAISPITNSSVMSMINIITANITSFLPSKSTTILIHFEWTSSTSTHCTSISISSSNRSQ